MSAYHPVKATLAILCMLLFLGCLGILAWAANRGSTVNGPIHIATDDTGVYVSFNEDILVLDMRGSMLARHRLDELGIGARPVDLRAAGDGSLLVATQRPAGLHRCDLLTWQCRAINNPLFSELRGQIKVLPDPYTGGLLISDTAGGQLHWLSADGQSAHPITGAKQFKRVNDIALDMHGRLWVADSGHHRLVILAHDAGNEWHIQTELSARTDLARPGLDWPMMIAFSAAGNAWVVQPDGGGGEADLLIYGLPQGAKARVVLPVGRYPTDVTRLGDSMLITDMDASRIERITIENHDVTPFGDAGVQQLLAGAAAEKAAFDRRMDLALAGMLLFGVLMIALAVWASPKGKRFSAAPNVVTLEARAVTTPPSGGLHWLVRNEKTERFLRMAQAMLLATTLAMFGVLIFTFYLLDRVLKEKGVQEPIACVTSINELLVLFGMLALGALLLGYLGFRSLRNRLGSDGHYLHVQLHNGQHLALEPERLVYTRRLLAYQQHLFPIQTGNRKSLYAEGEIETYVAPLLGRATQLGALGMLRYQLRHREPAIIASLAYGVTVAAVLWYTGLWRLLFARSA